MLLLLLERSEGFTSPRRDHVNNSKSKHAHARNQNAPIATPHPENKADNAGAKQ